MGKLLLLTLNKQEETAIDKVISTIADYISPKNMQPIPFPASRMPFPGLEIRQIQHRHCPHTDTDI